MSVGSMKIGRGNVTRRPGETHIARTQHDLARVPGSSNIGGRKQAIGIPSRHGEF